METSRLRSPLRHKPLRLPGQSLDEAIETLFWDKLGPALLFAFILAILAGFEWLTALSRTPPQPWLFTVFALAAALYAVLKFARLRAQFRRLVLGRDGERAVAKELEKLRADGAEVIHDVPAPGFNIDHVVLCRRGIFAIETKTWSKPQTGDARIHLTEKGIVANGRRPSRDPIAQAQGAAKWLARLLEDSTGNRFPVRGAVLFPGWFIERMGATWRRTPELPWVLEPKALASFIVREPQSLTESELRTAASSLAQYVRSAPSNT